MFWTEIQCLNYERYHYHVRRVGVMLLIIEFYLVLSIYLVYSVIIVLWLSLEIYMMLKVKSVSSLMQYPRFEIWTYFGLTEMLLDSSLNGCLYIQMRGCTITFWKFVNHKTVERIVNFIALAFCDIEYQCSIFVTVIGLGQKRRFVHMDQQFLSFVSIMNSEWKNVNMGLYWHEITLDYVLAELKSPHTDWLRELAPNPQRRNLFASGGTVHFPKCIFFLKNLKIQVSMASYVWMMLKGSTAAQENVTLMKSYLRCAGVSTIMVEIESWIHVWRVCSVESLSGDNIISLTTDMGSLLLYDTRTSMSSPSILVDTQRCVCIICILLYPIFYIVIDVICSW